MKVGFRTPLIDIMNQRLVWLKRSCPPSLMIIVFLLHGFFWCLFPRFAVTVCNIMAFLAQLCGFIVVMRNLDSGLKDMLVPGIWGRLVGYIKDFPVKGRVVDLNAMDVVSGAPKIGIPSLRCIENPDDVEGRLVYLQTQVTCLFDEIYADKIANEDAHDRINEAFRKLAENHGTELKRIKDSHQKTIVASWKWQLFGALLFLYGVVIQIIAFFISQR